MYVTVVIIVLYLIIVSVRIQLRWIQASHSIDSTASHIRWSKSTGLFAGKQIHAVLWFLLRHYYQKHGTISDQYREDKSKLSFFTQTIHSFFIITQYFGSDCYIFLLRTHVVFVISVACRIVLSQSSSSQLYMRNRGADMPNFKATKISSVVIARARSVQ